MKPVRSLLALGTAVALVSGVVVLSGGGTVQAETPPKTGPKCTVQANTPASGQTTLVDSTAPKVTSVKWSAATVRVATLSTVTVTLRTTDNCSGVGDLWVLAKNLSSGVVETLPATLASYTTDADSIDDVWTAELTVRGAQRGKWVVAEVWVLPAFTSLTYDSATATVVTRTPDPLTASDSAYAKVHPAGPPTVRVDALTKVTVDAAPEPITLGKKLTVSVRVTRADLNGYVAAGGVTVAVQVKAPGSKTWLALASVKTGSAGKAAATFTPKKKGVYTFRAVYKGVVGLAASTSPSDAVTVKPAK